MKIFADNKEVNIPPQWNLLTGTSDWSGDWTKTNQYSATTKYDSCHNLLLHYSGSWNGIQKKVSAFKNEIFAFGVNITNLETTQTLAFYSIQSTYKILAVYIDGKKINFNSDQTIPKENLFDKSEHRVELIAQAGSDDKFSLRIENTDDNGSMDLSSMKLERGSVATPWMPAIADLMLKNQNGGVQRPANPLITVLFTPSEMEVAA